MDSKYYYGENKEKAAKHAKEYRKKNVSKIAEYEKSPARRQMHERYDINHIEERRIRDRQHYQYLKRIVFEHYGMKCKWPDGCDVTDPDMLQIDHVNGGGYLDRKMYHTGPVLLNLIIRNGFPSSYRILCANHNWKARAILRQLGSAKPQRWNGDSRVE